MFKMYEKHVVLPRVAQERLRISRIDDRVDEVPDYLRADLSTDGGQSQMKALQDIEQLKHKRSQKIEQLKYAK